MRKDWEDISAADLLVDIYPKQPAPEITEEEKVRITNNMKWSWLEEEMKQDPEPQPHEMPY